MQNWFDYLTGNVPGGFGLYLLLISVLFAVLFGISRKNELFTTSKALKWSLSLWAVITLIYMALWFNNPPPAVFTRYSVFVSAKNTKDVWLAAYLRNQISQKLAPAQSNTDFFYDQRWNNLTHLSCDSLENPICESFAKDLPIHQLISVTVEQKKTQRFLNMELIHYPENKVIKQKQIPFKAKTFDDAISATLAWVKADFLISKNTHPPSLFNESFILGKEAFFRDKLAESRKHYQAALAANPNHPEILKWDAYSRIRLVKVQKRNAKPLNPYATEKVPWQVELEKARSILIRYFKAHYKGASESTFIDPMLNNMIAESFILDELYADAETFLKIGFGENPTNMDILQNVSLLHQSRFNELPFTTLKELFIRILNICPINEPILERYLEKLFPNVQITDVESAEIESRISHLLRANPESVTGLTLMGKFMMLSFKYDEALAVYQKAGELAPKNGNVAYNLGVIQFKKKNLLAAETAFKTAIALTDHLEAHLYLAETYKQQEKFEEALEHFRYRVANKKDDDDYYALQAMKGIRECLKALNIPIPGETN